MSNRHTSLAFDDINRMLKLVNELHSLPAGGDGPRRRRMLEGLCKLLGADAGESAVVRTDGAGVRLLSSVRVGRDGRAPVGVAAEGRWWGAKDPAVARLVTMLARRAGANGVVTRTRRDLAPRQTPSHGLAGEAVYSIRALDSTPGHAAVLCLERRSGNSGPMGPRDCRIVQLIHGEAGWVYETSPAATGDLTLRQRECLNHLLAGRSEKEIASDMRVSPHTVHVYVKAIYREAGVTSRAELMAKFMRPTGRRVRRARSAVLVGS